MRCSKVLTLLDDYAGGILPADRAGQVREHLEVCPECEQQLVLVREVTAPILSAWGDLEPPVGCFERIMERIEALPPEMHIPAARSEQPSVRFLRGGARWHVTSSAAAAAVLVAAIVLDRAADTDATRTAPERPARVAPLTAAVGGALKPGEMPLTRARFAITDDLEQLDGLRRRGSRDARERVSGDSRPFAVPVSADPLGVGPR